MQPESKASRPDIKKNILQLIFFVLQIHSAKPRSVKVIQWIFLLIPLVFIKTYWGYTFPLWWYDWFSVLSFLFVFACLYVYTRWSLYALRILAFLPFFAVFPIITFMLINFWSELLFGIYLLSLSTNDIVNSLDKITINPDILIHYFFWLGWIIVCSLIPSFVVYAYLWNQIDRFKYFEVKKSLTVPKPSEQIKTPL